MLKQNKKRNNKYGVDPKTTTIKKNVDVSPLPIDVRGEIWKFKNKKIILSNGKEKRHQFFFQRATITHQMNEKTKIALEFESPKKKKGGGKERKEQRNKKNEQET